MAKIASINFHPAPPKYRGRGGINYALYNEEKKFGVTVHLMDQKIDNGKIIAVKYFKIPKNCTVEKLFNLTLRNLYLIANIIFKRLKNNPKNLHKMLEVSKKFKWSKKLFSTRDMNKFYKLGVIKNQLNYQDEKLLFFEKEILKLKNNKVWNKKKIKELFSYMIPDFGHKETGKSLDSKM